MSGWAGTANTAGKNGAQQANDWLKSLTGGAGAAGASAGQAGNNWMGDFSKFLPNAPGSAAASGQQQSNFLASMQQALNGGHAPQLGGSAGASLDTGLGASSNANLNLGVNGNPIPVNGNFGANFQNKLPGLSSLFGRRLEAEVPWTTKLSNLYQLGSAQLEHLAAKPNELRGRYRKTLFQQQQARRRLESMAGSLKEASRYLNSVDDKSVNFETLEGHLYDLVKEGGAFGNAYLRGVDTLKCLLLHVNCPTTTVIPRGYTKNIYIDVAAAAPVAPVQLGSVQSVQNSNFNPSLGGEAIVVQNETPLNPLPPVSDVNSAYVSTIVQNNGSGEGASSGVLVGGDSEGSGQYSENIWDGASKNAIVTSVSKAQTGALNVVSQNGSGQISSVLVPNIGGTNIQTVQYGSAQLNNAPGFIKVGSGSTINTAAGGQNGTETTYFINGAPSSSSYVVDGSSFGGQNGTEATYVINGAPSSSSYVVNGDASGNLSGGQNGFVVSSGQASGSNLGGGSGEFAVSAEPNPVTAFEADANAA